MKWLKTKITTSGDRLAALEGILYDLGHTSYETEDGDEFAATLEAARPMWDYVDSDLYDQKKASFGVTLYLPDDAGGAASLDALRSALTDDFTVTVTSEDDADWEDNWKAYFKPLPIGDRILINPVWEPIPPEYADRTVFIIDPGVTFGTGSHETTRLCLETMEKYIHGGERVLDLGCGSGILSLTALLLGAENALAADIDPLAADISAKNAALNNIAPGRFTALCGNILTDPSIGDGSEYDVILANIVADVIIPAMPFIVRRMAPRGTAILSGIIAGREDGVLAAVESCGLEVSVRSEENDWICLSVRRRQSE